MHIGERLYEEGVVEKQLKYKRAEELKDKLTPEEWSCSRCGTFQKVLNTSIVIQPLHQMQSKARILNNTEECEENETKQTSRICKFCGFDQSKVASHRPVNVALSLSEEAEDLLRSRWQGSEPKPDSGGIHQYLYENARTRENIQQLNRVLWNEAHSGLTFAPVIPESSVEILEKYKSSATQQQPLSAGSPSGFNIDDSVHAFSEADAPQAPPIGLGQGKDKSIIAGPAIGEYFSKSATERLSTTQTRPVLANAMHAHRRPAETESRASTLNPAGQEQFVNRLVYEYKDKRERQQKLLEYATKHDLNTGEEWFKPQVGPDPSEALGFGSTAASNRNRENGAKKNVFESIMEKDRMLQIRRQQAQERAAAAMMEELSRHQVKALDTSQQILQQSTENNIAELFQVLLEAQEEVIQDESTALPSSDGTTSPTPEWTRLLLDLDQINPDLLIPEVGVLLNEIRAYKLNMQHSSASSRKSSEGEISYTANMLVSYASFKVLILKCMKRRDGTGRSYVYIPRKKPDVTMQMIEEHRREETFHPRIDPNSAALCMKRYKDTSEYPIEALLQVEGERIRTKWETARQALILQSSKELTFHPKLYKPPSYVKPKYWGMEEAVPETESDTESEERKGTSGDGAAAANSKVSEIQIKSVGKGGGKLDLGEKSSDDGDADADAPLNSSSLVSSDEEQQVVHMPALQPRSATAAQSQAHRTKNGLTKECADRAYEYTASRSPPHNLSSSRSSRKNQPAPISPVSAVSDDITINTISTKFTADEVDVRCTRRPDPSGRSVGSGNPMVTRRALSNTSGSARKSGLATSNDRTSSRASLSSSNVRKLASSGGSKLVKPPPPPLPIDMIHSESR